MFADVALASGPPTLVPAVPHRNVSARSAGTKLKNARLSMMLLAGTAADRTGGLSRGL
jgi:hypothetical protein